MSRSRSSSCSVKLPMPQPALQDAVADERSELAEHPAVEAAGPPDALEHVVAVVRGEAPVEEPVLEQQPEGLDAVLPADVLALCVAAAVVADGHLVDARVPLGQPRGELGLDAEAVALEGDLLEDVGADGLVAGLHVGQVDVVQRVGDEGQELVGQAVPEEQHGPLLAGGEARAEHRVGVALEDRREHARIVLRVVLQVAVLHDGDVARALADGPPDGRPLAPVAVLEEHADAIVPLGQLGEDLARAVLAAVVDGDELDLQTQVAHGTLQHLGHDGPQRASLVVHGHQHAELAETGGRCSCVGRWHGPAFRGDALASPVEGIVVGDLAFGRHLHPPNGGAETAALLLGERELDA